MIALFLLHLLVGAALLLWARPLRRVAAVAAALPMIGTCAFVAASWDELQRGEGLRQSVRWVPGLELGIDLLADGVSGLMLLLVGGIGLAVVRYARDYFGPTVDAARTLGLLVLFAGSMAGVVVADHVIVLYGFWELTSITSWLLIGQRHDDADARAAARHALLVTAAGGLCLLLGLVGLAHEAGTWSLAGILDAAPAGAVSGVALVLIGVGIVTKSAQYPTHAWLPGAMVAPTPVSAYLHSATMVKAGIYLALRFAPVFATVAGGWRPVLVVIGLFTMIAGGLRALRQDDLKLLLAMGTVSQLGLLLVLSGAGWEEATAAAVVLLVAHALFKATAFLVVGIVDHQLGTRDRRTIDGLGRGWLAVRVAAVVAAASMAGVAPLAGFIAKEKAYDAALHHGAGGIAVLIGLVAGSALTVAYSIRFGAVFLRSGGGTARPPSVRFAAPVIALTAVTVAAGVAPAPVMGPVVDAAVSAAVPGAETVELALWHGLNVALLLSAATLSAGIALFLWTVPFTRGTQRYAPRVDGAEAFERAVRGIQVVAHAVTGRIQSGVLSRYAMVTLAVVLVAPAAVLALGDAPLWPGVGDVDAVAVVLVVAVGGVAAATTLARRRFVAVLLLGSVGYGMAGLFALAGAPDLALTQFVVETLAIVAFMLVLRHLPSTFTRGRRRWELARLFTAAAVGAAVLVLALASGSLAPPSTAAAEAITRAPAEAEGKNVVNVVLVDFRGLDTLGEITVLVVAAVGVTALARIGRHPDAAGAPRQDEPELVQ